MKTENEKPTPEKYGWHNRTSFDEPEGGWQIEGGEEAYYEALKEWENEQKKHTMEITKVNPQEFGLDVEKASKIENAFAPVIVERDGLIAVYETILTSEISPELCKQAKELRNKLVKLRTSTDRIHKVEKAFFLAAGRFVDAWKNKTNTTIEEMESRLYAIENHYVILEQKRVAELETERVKMVAEYSDIIPAGLGIMDDSIFAAYLQGLKVAKEARKKAEAEAEKDRQRLAEIQRLHDERKEMLLQYWQHLTPEERSVNYREMEAVEFENLLSACNSRKVEADKKALEAENERKRLAAENEKKQKELEAERAEKQRLADQLAQKERAEKERIEAEKAAKAKAAKAPDKEKIVAYINSLSFENLEMKTMEGATVLADIKTKFDAFKNWAVKQCETI